MFMGLDHSGSQPLVNLSQYIYTAEISLYTVIMQCYTYHLTCSGFIILWSAV